jgi:hypothetical protein
MRTKAISKNLCSAFRVEVGVAVVPVYLKPYRTVTSGVLLLWEAHHLIVTA